MHAVKWAVGALAVLGIAVGSVVLGLNLLPPGEIASGKGTWVPWMLTWAMIWITVLVAIGVAGAMAAYGLSGPSHADGTSARSHT